MTTLPYQLARITNPKRLLAAILVCIGAFALLGFAQAHVAQYNLQAFDLRDSDLDARLSMPATFTSILLACAALLSLSLAAVDKHSRSRRWRRAGIVLAVLALEELLGIHSWLQDRGVPWSVCYLPLLAIAVVLLFDAMRILTNQPRTQTLFGSGLVAWVLGGALDGSTVHGIHHFGGIEILEMCAGAFFTVAMLARCQYLARAFHPIDEVETRPRLEDIVGVVIDRIDFRKIAIWIGIVTGAFAIQYVLLHTGNYHHAEKLAVLDLNNEQTLWATFQGSLIWIAAGLSLLIGLIHPDAERRRWWLLLGGVLFVLGSDEVIAIHDRFQDVTGYPGQIILAPVAIVGIVAWWKVLQELSANRLACTLLITGAAIWAYSQASDILLNPSFRWTITPEEVGETVGSTCWVFALLVWLRMRLERPPEREIEALEEAKLLDDGQLLAAHADPRG
jgi:hypothetical protein